jgi:hypothetical protein
MAIKPRDRDRRMFAFALSMSALRPDLPQHKRVWDAAELLAAVRARITAWERQTWSGGDDARFARAARA